MVRRAVRWRSALVPTILVASAVACSGSGDDGAQPVTAPSGGPSSAPPGGIVEVVGADGVAFRAAGTVGDGRATLARHDPASGRTVYATTTRVLVRDGADAPLVALTDVATRISALAVEPGGRRVAVVTESPATLTVWDLDERTAVIETVLDGSAPTLVAFAGPSVLVAAPDRVVAQPLDGAAASDVVVAEPGDQLGRVVVVAGVAHVPRWSDTARRLDVLTWSASSGTSVAGGIEPSGSVLDAPTLAADGSLVGVTVADGDPFDATYEVWDVGTGERAASIPAPGRPSGATVAMTAGAVLVGSESGVAVHAPDGTPLGALEPRADPVQAATVAGDGFVVQYAGGALVLVDGRGRATGEIDAGASPLVDLSVSADGGEVVAVDLDGAVRRWRAPDAAELGVAVELAAGTVNGLAFSPDGGRLAVATSAGHARVLDPSAIRDGADATVAPAGSSDFDEPGLNLDAVSFSADGGRLAVAVGERRAAEVYDDTVRVWDVTTTTTAFEIGGEGEQIAGCAFFRNEVRFSPAGDVMATNSHDFRVSLWNVDDGSLLATLPPHASTVLDVAFSPDGTRLVTSADDSTMRVWRVADQELLAEVATPPGGYRSIEFLPDGSALAAIDVFGQIGLVDPADGRTIRPFEGLAGSGAGGLSVSPDGSLVAAGGEQAEVVLWSTGTGDEVGRLTGHTAPVTDVAFSPDGSTLASGGRDGTVRIWDRDA